MSWKTGTVLIYEDASVPVYEDCLCLSRRSLFTDQRPYCLLRNKLYMLHGKLATRKNRFINTNKVTVDLHVWQLFTAVIGETTLYKLYYL